MRLDRVKPGKRIQANVRGRTFEAPVLEKVQGGVRIDPPKGITYHFLTARQIEKVVA